ncbi:MAG TPA: PAS domain S-box protein, partial [Acidimicrobiales bacterium]|nr:PAS domain S-box protein [Acidimicrobiales bacterium]
MSGDPVPYPAFVPGEDRFRALSEHVEDVALVVGVDGRLLYVSPSAQDLLGYDPSGAIGTDVFQLVDDHDDGALRASFGDLVARRRLTVAFEMQALRADGSSIDVEIVATGLSEALGGIVV